MTGRQIRRLLYGLLILALFVIVLHSGRSAYWLAKDGHYSERSRLHAEAPADYSEQQVVWKTTVHAIYDSKKLEYDILHDV